MGYSDVLILSKNDLNEILQDFPGIRGTLVEHAIDELRRSKKLSTEVASDTNTDDISEKDLKDAIVNLNQQFHKVSDTVGEVSELSERVEKVEHMVADLGDKLDKILKCLPVYESVNTSHDTRQNHVE